MIEEKEDERLGRIKHTDKFEEFVALNPLIFNSEYQPNQTLSDYSPEQLTESSAIEGFQPLKYSVVGNRAETFEARDDSWCSNHGWIHTSRVGDIIPCTSCNDMICGACRCGGCGNCENSDCCECKKAETFNADSKEEARLKKYEKTYGKEGAKVRNRIFKRILAKAQDGTKAGQWSARKAQSLAEEYEEEMGKKGKKPYKSSKKTKSQKSLKDWGDQDWRTKSGKKSSKTGERYLPAKAIDSLTDEEYKKTSAKKRKDMKKGKQFSDQPKSIAKKTKKYRAEFTDNCEFCPNDVKVISDDDGYACVDCGALTCYGCGSGDEEKYPYCPSCLEKFESESNKKPSSVEISRSSNSEKKLMAVFYDDEGKKMKTTHFGQRGASDYTKHGDKERMERYLERHGGGFETSTKEDWKDPTTAGSLSRWILWNKPSLKGSFDDYKSRFGLKGSINVSKSAEEKRQLISELVCFKCGVKDEIANYNWNENAKGCCGMGVREKRYYANKSAEQEASFPFLHFTGAILLVSAIPLFLDNRRDKV